ncbi:MAG: bifunctional 4-hydroxy-2-oxoglutarate aldolase/2-dehydro-3-deoxy-phosphogluconate aldolase [Burkholderiales bacterium]
MTPADIRDRLIAQRVVPVLRLASAEETEHAVDCLTDAGFRTFEITLTTPGAVALIGRLAARADWLVGAGTVLDLDSARACVQAGAKFLVSPCLVPGMARLAHEAGRAALIGGFTPGEILAGHREGADIVKVFPASTGGPEHLRAIHAVFPDIRLCPTGGVSLQNLESYFAAGAALVGVGNNIVDQRALAAGDRARVVAHARRFLEPGAAVSAA